MYFQYYRTSLSSEQSSKSAEQTGFSAARSSKRFQRGEQYCGRLIPKHLPKTAMSLQSGRNTSQHHPARKPLNGVVEAGFRRK
jgi:hypothetical protein